MELLILVGLAVLIGTLFQRLSGIGVGLIVAPVLALALGPATGVLLTNAATAISGFVLTLSVWRDVSWRRWVWIIVPALLGVVPGAWLVRTLPPGWLQMIVGATVTFALITFAGLRRLPRAPARSGGVVVGAIGGLLNVTAGVAAPVMVIYARMTRWNQREFGATMQPVFMTLGLASLLTKSLLGLGPDEGVATPQLFTIIVGAILVGTIAGSRIAVYLAAHRARQLALTLAAAGGLTTLVRGLVSILS